MSVIAQQQNQPVTFTMAAAKRIQSLIKEEGNYNLKLRVYITGGGCSGFQYGFAFDEAVRDDDAVIEKEVPLDDEEGGSGGEAFKVNVVIDALSIMYLMGAEIDYIESLQGAHFTVKNPNPLSTCSCGSSFAL